jgi:TonB family protein
MKYSALLLIVTVGCFRLSAQTNAKTDSVVRAILGSESVTGDNKGTELILNGNLSAAGQFYDSQISKDISNTDAYLGRGVVHLAMSDTLNACRDWSAVLALGDTATYNLLESHCHATMVIEDDVIPAKRYRKMFPMERKNGKTLDNVSPAQAVVEVMPEFPGGEKALIDYLSKSVKTPAAARKNKISGVVYINFIISSKGTIMYPYVVRGIGYGCDEEAIRVVKNMPKWSPGKQRNKAVLVRYNLPVRFR